MNINVDDLVAILAANQPKVYWECSADMWAGLHWLRDNRGHPVLATSAVPFKLDWEASEPATLLGVPIRVQKTLAPRQLTLCVHGQLPGSGIMRFDYTPPCECRELKLIHQNVKYQPSKALVCTECGKPSDKYDVLLKAGKGL